MIPGIDSRPWSPTGPQGALLTKNAQQTIANNTVTAVIWQTVVYDTRGFFSSANNTRLTVPPGVRLVRASGCAAWVAANFRRDLVIHKNGVDFTGQGRAQFISGLAIEGNMNVVSAPVQVVAGDYFELVVFQNVGGNETIDNQPNTWFGIEALQ
jgi:hypothetical protein